MLWQHPAWSQLPLMNHPSSPGRLSQVAPRSSISTGPLGFFTDSFSPPCTSSTALPKLSYLLTHWLRCSGLTWRHNVSCTPVLHQCLKDLTEALTESCFPQNIPLSCFNKSLRGNQHKASVTSASLPLRMMRQTQGSKTGFCDRSTGNQRNAAKCSSPRWGKCPNGATSSLPTLSDIK